MSARLMWQPLVPAAPAGHPSLSPAASSLDGMPSVGPGLARLESSVVLSNAGDRVLLPGSMLEACLSASGGDFPLTFELRAFNSTRTYVGVQEFTSPSDIITLPRAVMDALNLRPEDALNSDKAITVRYVKLPKASAVKLSPLTSDFLDISDPRPFLESALRNNFTLLLNGQIVTLRHEGRNYQVLVSDLQPADAPAAVIVDTDCAVDIGEPMDGGKGRRRGTAFIKMGELVHASVQRGEYAYYSVTIPREVDVNAYDVKVEVHPTAGSSAPDVYVSQQPVRKPVLSKHVWAMNAPGATQLWLVDTNRSLPPSGTSELATSAHGSAGATVADMLAAEAAAASARTYYIGVTGWAAPSEFSLQVDITPKSKEHPCVNLARDGGARTDVVAAAAAAASAAPPGTKLCPTCGSFLPDANYALHVVQCARTVFKCTHAGCGAMLRRTATVAQEHWHCPVCSLVMHSSWGDKHQALVHTPLACECGISLPLHELHQHAASACPSRAVTCRFCGASTRAGAPPRDAGDRLRGLTEHESYCGSRTGVCSFEGCTGHYKLKEVDAHFALVHPGVPVTPATIPIELPVAAPTLVHGDTDESMAFGRREDDEAYGSRMDEDEPARPAWACPTCTLQNAGTDAFCTMCSTPRTGPSIVPTRVGDRVVPLPAPVALCCNQTCCNPVSRVGDAALLRLCHRCFRMFASEYSDSEALNDSLATRYMSQLEAGCGEPLCRNPYCASARAYGGGSSSTSGLPDAPPLLRHRSSSDALMQLLTAAYGTDGADARYWVCVPNAQRTVIRPASVPATAAGEDTTAPASAAAVLERTPTASPSLLPGAAPSVLSQITALLGGSAAPVTGAAGAAARGRTGSGASDRDRRGRVTREFFK